VRDVVLDVDLLSFLGDAERAPQVYRVPVGTVLPTPITIEPQTIELIEGFDAVVEVGGAQVTVTLEFDNHGGAATVHLELYLSGASGDGAVPHVYDRSPVHAGAVELPPASTVEHTFEIDSAEVPALVDVFASETLVVGLALYMDALGAATDVAGTWAFIRFDAVVLGTGELAP
jgi:hypothetical protein